MAEETYYFLLDITDIAISLEGSNDANCTGLVSTSGNSTIDQQKAAKKDEYHSKRRRQTIILVSVIIPIFFLIGLSVVGLFYIQRQKQAELDEIIPRPLAGSSRRSLLSMKSIKKYIAPARSMEIASTRRAIITSPIQPGMSVSILPLSPTSTLTFVPRPTEARARQDFDNRPFSVSDYISFCTPTTPSRSMYPLHEANFANFPLTPIRTSQNRNEVPREQIGILNQNRTVSDVEAESIHTEPALSDSGSNVLPRASYGTLGVDGREVSQITSVSKNTEAGAQDLDNRPFSVSDYSSFGTVTTPSRSMYSLPKAGFANFPLASIRSPQNRNEVPRGQIEILNQNRTVSGVEAETFYFEPTLSDGRSDVLPRASYGTADGREVSRVISVPKNTEAGAQDLDHRPFSASDYSSFSPVTTPSRSMYSLLSKVGFANFPLTSIRSLQNRNEVPRGQIGILDQGRTVSDVEAELIYTEPALSDSGSNVLPRASYGNTLGQMEEVSRKITHGSCSRLS